jgi:hypothetical protein
MPHAAFQKSSPNMLHRSMETTTVAIPTRRAGFATPLRPAETAAKGEIVHCTIFSLHRRQHQTMFLLSSAAIVLAETSEGQEAVPKAGRFL